MLFPAHPPRGYQFKTRGWTVEVKGDREVEVRDPTHGFCDTGQIEQDGTVHYQNAERVPKDVRTAVKILGRKLLAQDLQR